MVRVSWGESAQLDLAEINEYISKQSKKHAEIELKRIVDSSLGLLSFPMSGKVVSHEYTPTIRQIISRNYKILYQYFDEKEEVSIVRIVHGSLNTNLDKLVFDPEGEYQNHVRIDEAHALTPEEEEAVAKGIEAIEKGQIVTHEEIKKMVDDWFKDLPQEE